MIAARDRTAEHLAGALLARAAVVLPRMQAHERVPSLDALERFVATRTASAFLAAARVLSRDARDACIERLDGEGGRRAFADAVGALRATSALPEVVVDRLAGALSETRAEGKRLDALASLLAAWRELAGRVSADTERLRRELRAAGLRGRRRPS